MKMSVLSKNCYNCFSFGKTVNNTIYKKDVYIKNNKKTV